MTFSFSVIFTLILKNLFSDLFYFHFIFQRLLSDRSDRTHLVNPPLFFTGFNRIELESDNLLRFRICDRRIGDLAPSLDQDQLESGLLADRLDLQF